jgi:hypothetical protein
MTSIYEDYGERARERLKVNFDARHIQDDLKYAERDIKDITEWMAAAEKQLAVIEQTVFKRYIEFRKDYDYYLKKIDFSVSVYRVPQSYSNLKVYVNDVSNRWVGNDKRKDAIAYTFALMQQFPDAELVGNGADIIRAAKKKYIQLRNLSTNSII